MDSYTYYCVVCMITNCCKQKLFCFIVPPRILVHPKTMNYIIETEDDQITLNCTVDGEGVVYWQKDGVNISGSEMPITSGGNTLDIAPDSITDTSVGMYRCIASNNVGSVVSNAASITVTGRCILLYNVILSHREYTVLVY